MVEKCKYPKEFYCKTNFELTLKNNENIKNYIDKKVKLLISNKENSSIIRDIFKEIKELIEYDENNSTIINMELNDTTKRQSIKKYDIICIVGSIFSEYHKYLIENDKNRIPNISFNKFIINYNQLYDEAITDYFRALLQQNYNDIFSFKSDRIKKNGINLLDKYYSSDDYMYFMQEYRFTNFPMSTLIPEECKISSKGQSFTAAFAFPALIERIIVDILFAYYLDKGIEELITHDKYTDDDEIKVIQQLTGIEDEKGKIIDIIHFPNNADFQIKIINMIRKYTNWNKKIYKIFGRIELGHIISNEGVFKDLFKPECFYLLNILFYDLNIRNDIMHLNNENSNYFSVELSSIMLEILWLVYDRIMFEMM